jgi:hypothetical protein
MIGADRQIDVLDFRVIVNQCLSLMSSLHMNNFRRLIFGSFVLGSMTFLSLGCGGDGGGADSLEAAPDLNAPPPDPKTMMPGFTPGPENKDAPPATP